MSDRYNGVEGAAKVPPLARARRSRLVKRVEPLPDVNPIKELIRIVNNAQERDAEGECRLYFQMGHARESSYPGGTLDAD
jgi:hypothetical protein